MELKKHQLLFSTLFLHSVSFAAARTITELKLQTSCIPFSGKLASLIDEFWRKLIATFQAATSAPSRPRSCRALTRSAPRPCSTTPGTTTCRPATRTSSPAPSSGRSALSSCNHWLLFEYFTKWGLQILVSFASHFCTDFYNPDGYPPIIITPRSWSSAVSV